METPASYRCVISSEEHLAWFFDLERRNPVWRKLLGISEIPKGFPHLRVPRVALPFYAAGELVINKETLRFSAQALRVRGLRVCGLQENLRWVHDISELEDVQLYVPDAAPSVPRGANLNWLKLLWRSHEAPPLLVAELDEFLVPNGPRSDYLLNRLRLLMAVRKWRRDTGGHEAELPRQA